MRQKFDRPLAVGRDAARLGLERVDEEFADGLPLHLRIVEPFERAEELLRRVDMDERDVEVAAEEADHLLRLALAQEAVIDEDAGELVADRLVDQDRRDRRIDAAREAADDPRFADLRADAGDLLGAERRHRPVALEARDLMQEIGDELRAVGRVDHLGVEHRGVVAALFVRRDRVGRVLRHGVDAEALRKPRHPVAVAHPHRIAPARLPDALEQGAARDDLDVGAAEFRRMPALDLAAELLCERLLAVADGEDRNAALEDRLGRARAAGFRNRGRPAGEDHRLRLQPANASAALENGWISQ